MRRLLLIGFIALAGCGGNDGPISRIAGSWPGVFEIESGGSLGNEPIKGNLELYATGMKFLFEVKTPHQAFTIKGKWKAAKNRATIVADNFVFSNPSDEDQKALKVPLISPDAIRSAFAHEVIFDESPDKRKLAGLKTSLGGILGHFQFERPLPR